MGILTMPISFDQNEIFVSIIAGGLILIFILLPKRFPIHLLILFLLINSFIGRTVDTTLAIPPFDIYDSFDANKHELFDEITYSIVYSIYGYLFYYFYDKFHSIPSWVNVLAWTLLSTISERTSVYFNVFQYQNWHLFYSFLVYILVYILHVIFYRLMTKQLNYSSERVKSVQR
ncbi:hypothetical protein CJ195_16820 [Bacillus sp. UMB0899]|uniref:hypothetical protein n=1 Tax=Metabacillus schmidteae TaxID=2730405 RepID=UPI000C801130|nr:hypothetical protein [Metabacillus schmidteae]PMC35921.1 hypothetical protein CJ195_16820 [Bacillus sp. UMB0899]